jgi:hypothetical protein
MQGGSRSEYFYFSQPSAASHGLPPQPKMSPTDEGAALTCSNRRAGGGRLPVAAASCTLVGAVPAACIGNTIQLTLTCHHDSARPSRVLPGLFLVSFKSI